jgi:hypothetical protein
VLRSAIAAALPALALAVTSPGAFIFTVVLILVPAVVLSAFIRYGRLYAAGVAFSVAAAIAVNVQIAHTHDAQAGLAVLGLPIYMGAAVAILFFVDVVVRAAHR